MLSILKLTYHEYINRRIFFISSILYGIVILVTIFGLDQGLVIKAPGSFFMLFLFYFSLVILLFSGFDMFTKMIDDGSAELIIARPVSRLNLLLYKYISMLTVTAVSNLLFLLIISLIFFIKTGQFSFTLIRLFVFIYITCAIYYAYAIPCSLFFCRSNLNLMLFFLLILSNALPNLVSMLTVGNVDLTQNYVIYFFYTVSPQMVELCKLAIGSNGDYLNVFTHSGIALLICLSISFVIIKMKDF